MQVIRVTGGGPGPALQRQIARHSVGRAQARLTRVSEAFGISRRRERYLRRARSDLLVPFLP